MLPHKALLLHALATLRLHYRELRRRANDYICTCLANLTAGLEISQIAADKLGLQAEVFITSVVRNYRMEHRVCDGGLGEELSCAAKMLYNRLFHPVCQGPRPSTDNPSIFSFAGLTNLLF